MVRHAVLTGSDLHDPRGANGVPLNLTTNISNAFQMRNATTLNDILVVHTTTSNRRIILGDADEQTTIRLDCGNAGQVQWITHPNTSGTVDECEQYRSIRLQTSDAGGGLNTQTLWSAATTERRVISFEARILVAHSGGAGSFLVHGAARRYSGGSSTLIESGDVVSDQVEAAISSSHGVTVDLVSDSLRIRVTQGAAEGTSTWAGWIRWSNMFI